MRPPTASTNNTKQHSGPRTLRQNILQAQQPAELSRRREDDLRDTQAHSISTHGQGGSGRKRQEGKRRSSSFSEGDDGEFIPVNIPEDGHFWLKYGEKVVQNSTSTSPLIRSYFRCGEQHQGKACPARKTITWDVGVKPIRSNTAYAFKHGHPPSDNPRQSIRPMRKLRIPSSITTQQFGVTTEPLRLAPHLRQHSCPDLGHLLGMPLNAPVSPGNSSQLQMTDVPVAAVAARALSSRSLSLQNIASLFESCELSPVREATGSCFRSLCSTLKTETTDGDNVSAGSHPDGATSIHGGRPTHPKHSPATPCDPPTSAPLAEDTLQWQNTFLQQMVWLDDYILQSSRPSEDLFMLPESTQSGLHSETAAGTELTDLVLAESPSTPAGFHCDSSSVTAQVAALLFAAQHPLAGLGPSTQGEAEDQAEFSLLMPSHHLQVPAALASASTAVTAGAFEQEFKEEGDIEHCKPQVVTVDKATATGGQPVLQQHCHHQLLPCPEINIQEQKVWNQHQHQKHQKKQQERQQEGQQKQQQKYSCSLQPQGLNLEQQAQLQQQLLLQLLQSQCNLLLQLQQQQQQQQQQQNHQKQQQQQQQHQKQQQQQQDFMQVPLNEDQHSQYLGQEQVECMELTQAPGIGGTMEQCLNVALQAICLHLLFSELEV